MKSVITALVAAALLVTAAPAASVLIVEEIIAKVNGDIVTRSEYERVLGDGLAEIERNKEMPEQQKAQRKADQERNALRDLIDQRLLIQRGKDLSISVEAQVLRQRDQLMKDFKLTTVEEFDPTTDRWTLKGPMPTHDRRSMGVASVNGRVYAVGGCINGSCPSATVESYDPAA